MSVYTVVVYTRIRLSYKLGYLFIQWHDASCHRLEVGMIRCRGSATGAIVEDGEGSESPCQFQEVIPLRQYQLRSMFPGRDREMLGEDRVGVAQYQMVKPKGSRSCSTGRFSGHRKHLRSFRDRASTLAPVETIRAGLNCARIENPPISKDFTCTASSAL